MELPYSRVGVVLALWIIIAIAGAYPVHAQSTGTYAGALSRMYVSGCRDNTVCPYELGILIQGQGQVCWTAQNYWGIFRDPPPIQGCITSSTVVTFFYGDAITFTATGSNGYMFDHWIMPDKDTYNANPVDLSIPVPVEGNPMIVVFASGTGVPEFSQAFLMLGATIIIAMAVLRRQTNASRRL